MKLADLNIGDKITDSRSGLVFSVAAKDHAGYNGIVAVCDNIVRCAAFDAAEPEATGKPMFDLANLYGRNDYALSNIHQWLNSDATFWYRPTHSADAAPKGKNLHYDEQPNADACGFLRELSVPFVSAMVESDVPVLRRTAKEKGELTTIKAKVFLPSRTEIGMGDESGFAEGSPMAWFAGRAHLTTAPTQRQTDIWGRSWNPGWDYGLRGSAKLGDAQIFDPKYVWWWWCRTPHLAYSYLVRVMNANGGFSYTMAYNDIVGVRPMAVLSPDAEINGGVVV